MEIRRQMNTNQENKSDLFRISSHFSQVCLKPFEGGREHTDNSVNKSILMVPNSFCHKSSLKALKEHEL